MLGGLLYTLPSVIFFGETKMSTTTAARLDPTIMEEIKQLIVSKFAVCGIDAGSLLDRSASN